MADAIEELRRREPTNAELRAALMNAMRRIEELESRIVDLDDCLLSLYRRTGHIGAERPARGSAPVRMVWPSTP